MRVRKNTIIYCCAVLLAAIGLSCAPLSAQSPAAAPAGAINGVISGVKGVAVNNAIATITNTDTGVYLKRQTGADGKFSFPFIQPGPYQIEVVAPGYARLLQGNITVAEAKSVHLRIGLKIGPPPTTVTVTELPLDNGHASTTIGESIGNGIYTQSSAAAVPLFRDPIHDGAADPVVVWNRARKSWWMLYTNRRADLDSNDGVTWVHGTRIGIAESTNGGADWKYISEADIPVPAPDYTLWAPEVIDVDGTYHMFLTVVPGSFTDWNHPRHILHLTSKDLLHWTPLDNVNLPSDRTIDACVFRLPSGQWRLWYKDEADHSNVHFSDSPDLVHWSPVGIATRNGGEGPVVFQWHGAYWLINDPHKGLGVFRSTDLTTWTQQPDNLLREPGTQPTDHAVGSHADVVVDAKGRAWLFYFTQQGGENASPNTRGWGRRSVLHVTELHESNGTLTTDRNAPAMIHMLPPPRNKKSDVLKAWK